MGVLRDYYRRHFDFRAQKIINAPYDIRFYNFWNQKVPDMWFYRFIQSRQLLKDKNKKICFYSTFGNRDIVGKTYGDVNIFFTGENLKRGEHKRYADHLLCNPFIDLSLGFERFEDDKYLRFPLWIHYMFAPESRDEEIVAKCKQLNRPDMGLRSKFACHVSSEDVMGLREAICKQLMAVDKVDCAGKVMHNCDDLWRVFGDDKKAFLMNYKFNVCPENSNAIGYVTEKLFQAIEAGCVPIYWGCNNYPEQEVLNYDSILFWEKDGDNSRLLDFIGQLNASPSLYEEFASQNRLKASAAEYVIGIFDQLECRIKELL